jgi:acetoacetyl-CoA synthetase
VRKGSGVIWSPDPVAARQTALGTLVRRRGLQDFAALHRWSVEHPDQFWAQAWTELGIVGEPGPVAVGGEGFGSARFFPAARLNVVDTLLAGPEHDVVLIAMDEGGTRVELDRGAMRAQVAACAEALRAAGVGAGDRVAAWTPNTAEAAVFALGALAIGAIVSTASPDFGPTGIIERFGQVEPVVLMLSAHYEYSGRAFSCIDRLADVLAGLPSVRTVVVVGDDPAGHTAWTDWLAPHLGTPLVAVPLPFAHPGFILFSSGTTGRPKCIVHSAAGVLLKVLSEQVWHLDVRSGDRVLYFTTCGWMMWNWLICGLGTGAAVVLYDGSPAYPEIDRLFGIAESEALTFLGLSAKFIDSVRKSGLRPADGHDLSALRTVASTGSPLSREGFDFVYSAVSPSIHLASISGGTDICGCFVAGVPTEPVHRGEIQGPALGMDVAVFTDDGSLAAPGETGELVCRAPFPSVPVGFWGDEDGSRLQSAYFDRFPGVWAHGDFVIRTPSGGFEILGRSDATLNANGVRIGTAEIYRIVEGFDEVSESLAVGQAWDDDTRVVLFVTLAEGVELDEALAGRMRAALREQASPRHVPAVIVAAPALPRTRSNKLAELAVADTLNGRPVRDTSALANPESLAWFSDWARAD